MTDGVYDVAEGMCSTCNGFVALNKSVNFLLKDTSIDEGVGDYIVRLVFCCLPLRQYSCIFYRLSMGEFREFHNDDIILFVDLNEITVKNLHSGFFKEPMHVFFIGFSTINKPILNRQTNVNL